MKRNLVVLFCLLSSFLTSGQDFRHYDFVGAGHTNEIVVTTSSTKSNLDGRKTIDGFPIQNNQQLKDASRFLAQCTFGADMSTIQMTAAMGYEAWMEEQFSLPQISVMQEMVNQHFVYDEGSGDLNDPVYHISFRSAWITNNMNAPDLLRQRLAFNLSQIYVINDNTDLFEDVGQLMGGFYDMLQANAFGNYQELLTDVTLSPAMGKFLSHFNNPKEDLANNIHPDENYAREIMQLFSIGLWELNPNGTRKYDANGQFIPTYNNADIKEFAQVFTGLGAGIPNGTFGATFNETFDNAIQIALSPMKMYDEFHDKSEKKLLNGFVLPANQSGMEDVNQTISHLSNHPNTAPFICKSIIKMMTTSNPSPTYVSDVVAVFNPSEPNNFQKVIKAILLHPEARNCSIPETYTFGKLREPVVRLMNFFKAFPMTANEIGDYPWGMLCFANQTGQSPLEAPSVFNFFLPDYQPPGPISQNYLVAPEFQILNASNAMGMINDMNVRVIHRYYLGENCTDDEQVVIDDYNDDAEFETSVRMDYSSLETLANDPAAMVDQIDILIANGLLGEETKSIIVNAVSQLNTPREQVKMALYLTLLAPDYVILR